MCVGPTQTACTDAHSVSQHILNRMTTFHYANTRGSRAGRLRIAHLCVPKTNVTLAAFDTDHKHKFSLTYFTYLPDTLTNTHKIFGTRCCTLQCLHTVTLRMFLTCLLVSETLSCDMSRTRASFFEYLLVGNCTSLRPRVPYDGMGSSMETVRDSSRRHVPESLS